MPAPDNIETILERLARRDLTPRQAVRALESAGCSRADAAEYVFTALGGGDLVETGPDGLARYHHSGRLVSEVEAEMARGRREVKAGGIKLSAAHEQEVEKLVAQGWPRESAKFIILESIEDVIE